MSDSRPELYLLSTSRWFQLPTSRWFLLPDGFYFKMAADLAARLPPLSMLLWRRHLAGADDHLLHGGVLCKGSNDHGSKGGGDDEPMNPMYMRAQVREWAAALED